VNTILPDGEATFPEIGTGEGMREVGTTPSTVGVIVGNRVAVGNCETGAVGVAVGISESPAGVNVGTGLGGFCQTKINPPISTHNPITPQPRPLRRNRSKIAKNFLETSFD